jgi:hypothetical protein
MMVCPVGAARNFKNSISLDERLSVDKIQEEIVLDLD